MPPQGVLLREYLKQLRCYVDVLALWLRFVKTCTPKKSQWLDYECIED